MAGTDPVTATVTVSTVFGSLSEVKSRWDDYEPILKSIRIDYSESSAELHFSITTRDVKLENKNIKLYIPTNFTFKKCINSNLDVTSERPERTGDTITIPAGNETASSFTIVLEGGISQTQLDKLFNETVTRCRCDPESYEQELHLMRDSVRNKDAEEIEIHVEGYECDIEFDERYIHQLIRPELEQMVENSSHSKEWQSPHNSSQTPIRPPSAPPISFDIGELPEDERWWTDSISTNVDVEDPFRQRKVEVSDFVLNFPEGFQVSTRVNLEPSEEFEQGMIQFEKASMWENINNHIKRKQQSD